MQVELEVDSVHVTLARCGNPQNECENFACVLIKLCERASEQASEAGQLRSFGPSLMQTIWVVRRGARG